ALERDALVLARPYSERPPRFVYELTSAGRELIGVLRLLAGWGARNVSGEAGPRHAVCGTELEARWWCPTCQVPLGDQDAEELLRSLVPHLPRTVLYAVEVAAGAALLISAGLLWRNRERLCARGLPAANPKRSSSVLLGATISAVELPTAFPYFAAIAAILASNLGALRQLFLLFV